MPISRRGPSLPFRTSSDPRRGSSERFLDAQLAAPEHDDQRAQPQAVAIVAVPRMTARISSTVGGSADAAGLCCLAGGGMVARQRRWRAPPDGGIENL
jgi:hypothetical protein